jgi:signal transduction histidine kinase
VTVRAGVAGGVLTLVVADDGPGLPAEARRLLIDGREAQVPQAGSLGLWTVARLVRELDASVHLAGPPGTHVTIRIPDAEHSANFPAAA